MGNCCLKPDLQVWPEKNYFKSRGIKFHACKFEHALLISEYHFLAGSFKYRSLTFTSSDRQKQVQHLEGISVYIFCRGSTESKDILCTLTQAKSWEDGAGE